jgi:DNA helicase-2/ATP-dependent DNA helicase PcrA
MCKSETEIEEERRLLYVAITRAMERCTISYARQRFRNGSVNFSSPSRFLNDIDRQFVRVEEATVQRQSFGWLNSTWGSEPSGTSIHTTAAQEPQQTKMRPVTEAAKAVTDCQFKSGDRVSHRVFGNGTVTRVYRENDNDKIDINFDKTGSKTLLLSYAKLSGI